MRGGPVLVLALTAGLTAASVAGVRTPADAAAPRTADGLSATVVVAPADAGVLGNGDLQVAVALSDDGSLPIPAGAVRLALEQAVAADADTLLDALKDPTPYGQLQGYGIGSEASPAMRPGDRAVVRFTVPAAVVGAYTHEAGAHLLAAQLRVGDEAVAAGAAVATKAPTGSAAVRFAAIVPLTLPVADAPTGLAAADVVDALASPGGAWADALDAARADPAATLALDPAVLASIRALGTAAPQPATDLLAGLQALPNTVVELPYADGDVTLERAAGSSHVLGPTGFGGTVALTTGSANTPTSSASPTPQPTATPGAVTSGRASLTRWSWAATRVAWPVTGTVADADLPYLAHSGFGVTLLSSGDVHDTAARVSAGPLATVGSSKVLVADEGASELLDSTAADHGIAGDADLAKLVGLLAVDATGAGTRTVLIAPGRDAGGTGRLAAVLGALRAQPWIHDADLGDLTAARPAAVSLVQHAVTAATAARARTIVEADSAVQRLGAAITTRATSVTSPYRLAALAMLGAGWRSADATWASDAPAVASGIRRFAGDSVQLLRLDTVNYVGVSSGLPVSVRNALGEPVRVRITGVPSNGRMIVEGAVDATVGANQTSPLLKVPVRSISNGQVEISVTLSTPGGQQLGRPVVADVTVNAGWDTLGAGIFMGALLLLFGVGVYRNLTRRKRRVRTAMAA